MQTITNEITRGVLLCNPDGRLNPTARGWSRRPRHVCNLKGRFLRKKKWDYWCVMGDRFLFSATIAHVDFAATGFIYLLEYETGRLAEQVAFRLLPRKPIMPEMVGGHIRFEHGRLALAFLETKTGMDIEVRSTRFGGKPLEAKLAIERPETHETLNVVVPWNERTFQFTSKQCCLPTTGTVTWGDEVLAFEQDRAFATLDYGRGIWPYRTAWNWATFAGRAGPDVVGINMGAKWTDGTGMNENGIFLNGTMHKVFEDIVFEYDNKDFMKPWRMRTADSDTVDLHFEPFYEKPQRINLLLIASRANQVFGRYHGAVRAGGRAIPIDNLLGWAEEHVARW